MKINVTLLTVEETLNIKLTASSSWLLFILLLVGFGAKAQPSVPVSPEAAALTKMVNYPVNFNTGVPDISIPLYTIQSGGLSLPITLNYHAGGFKIHEKATRSGMGWSLSSDIQITRTVNGLDDLDGYISNDLIKPFYSGTTEYNFAFSMANAYALAKGELDGMPDKFNYKLLNKSGSFYFLKNQSGSGYSIVPVPFDNLKITYDNGEFTIVDTDGTIYHFGGKGVISTENVVQLYTELTGSTRTAFKCRKIENANRTEQLTFVYQAKAPVKFYHRQQSIEYFNNPDPCNMGAYVTDAVIQAEYPGISNFEALMERYRFFRLSSPKYKENFANGYSIFHLPSMNGNTVVDHTYIPSAVTTTYSINYGMALTQINFRTGSLEINGVEAVNSIRVKNSNAEEVKKINFHQSVALPDNNNAFPSYAEFLAAGTRYLDSIEFVGNGQRFETYKLQYGNKFCFGGHLQGKDVWGYANGFTTTIMPSNNFTAVPEVNIVQDFYRSMSSGCTDIEYNALVKIGSSNSQQRNIESTDETVLSAGMLRRMVYPTGGYVDFEYESNSARQMVGNNLDIVAMTGGLRVKTISQYDGLSDKPASYKYYRYGDLEEGTGFVLNSPYLEYDVVNRTFKPFHYTQTLAYLGGLPYSNMGEDFAPIPSGCTTPNCIWLKFKENKTTYLPASSSDYTYPHGAPIYYTKVTEYNQDLGKMTGKRVYTYYKPNDFGAYSFISEAKIPGTNIDVLQTDGLMGQPKSIEDYEFKNGDFLLAHSKLTTYKKFSKPAQVRVIYCFQKIDFSMFEGIQLSDMHFLYGGIGMSFQNQSYSFDDVFKSGQYGIQIAKLLPETETERWYSNGLDFVENVNTYEYNNASYPQVSKVTTSAKNDGTISKVFKYAYDFAGTEVCDTMKNRNMISQVLEEISYATNENNVQLETGRSKTNYARLNAGMHVLPVTSLKSVGGNALDTVMTFDLYGDHENILQLTEKNKLVKTYLWAYNDLYPIAEVKGAGYIEVTSAIGSSSIVNATTPSDVKAIGTAINSLLPNSMVSTYAYKPMVGVTAITGADGKSRYFSYDDYGRLLTVTDDQGYILKKHEYIIAKTPAIVNTFQRYNNPMMLTFNSVGSDNIQRTINAIQPANLFPSTYFSVDANVFAEADLNQNWWSIAGGVDAAKPEANVTLKLNTWPSGGPIPTAVYLDLIRDNTVVVSKRIPYNQSNMQFDELLVEPGEYKLAIRFENNYNGSLCRLTMGGSTVRTGDILNLQPNTDLTFILFNN